MNRNNVFNISKDCFPPATLCHNCKRKCRAEVTKSSKSSKDYKRCSGCHLLTYCDKDCQLEHWEAIHKNHCKLLSGKKVVANVEKHAKSCQHCVLQQKSNTARLLSSNSSDAICHINEVISTMQLKLGQLFGFHAPGKLCNCRSTKAACQLPFKLGEVFGQYLDENIGLDLMLAHAMKLLYAMCFKDQGRPNFKTLNQLWRDVVFSRLQLWYDFIVYGTAKGEDGHEQAMIDQVLSLKDIYGVTNPWWRALEFTVTFIESSCQQLRSTFYESRSLEDQRFRTVRLIRHYELAQLRNKQNATEKRTWNQFTFWPTLVNGSLEIVFLEGAQCHSCLAPLSGLARTMSASDGFEDRDKSRPAILPAIGEKGALMAWCPVLLSPTCLARFYQTMASLQSEDHKKENYTEQLKLFLCETRTCDLCLNYSLFSHRCSGCLAAQYCSAQCQQKDLNFHKTVCSKWAKDKSRKIMGGEKQKKYFKSNVVVVN